MYKVVRSTTFITSLKELHRIQLTGCNSDGFSTVFPLPIFRNVLRGFALDLIKSQTVRQIEILLVLFLVSITGEIGEGWLIYPLANNVARICCYVI